MAGCCIMRKFTVHLPAKGEVLVISDSPSGHTCTLKAEKNCPNHSEAVQDERTKVGSMFCPRCVSPWCMSRRKRMMDVLLSSLALVVFSPLMLLIAWLIRMTSHGPALFRQERVGLHQQTFIILKFRTMKYHCDALNSGPTVTRHRDSRMTKIGALLRRLKLDELPQLINVARGEMSFVGPRPKIALHENLCMLCRPGITGAATIEFSHEEALLMGVPEEIVERYVVSVLNPEKCKLDIRYMETTRFSTDLTILMNTIFKLSRQSRAVLSEESARFLTTKSGNEMKSASAVVGLTFPLRKSSTPLSQGESLREVPSGMKSSTTLAGRSV
jgi:lipopolysaccharide/colanic/teichoic acid biosynthesis glycosyltransferase